MELANLINNTDIKGLNRYFDNGGVHHTTYEGGETIMTLATRMDNPEVAAILLRNGYPSKPMRLLVEYRCWLFVKATILNGYDVSRRCKNGDTILSRIIEMVNDDSDTETIEIIEFVLSRGADPKMLDLSGMSAFDLARSYDLPRVLAILVNGTGTLIPDVKVAE